MEKRAAERAGRLTVRRFDSAAEADRHDLEFWAAILLFNLYRSLRGDHSQLQPNALPVEVTTP